MSCMSQNQHYRKVRRIVLSALFIGVLFLFGTAFFKRSTKDESGKLFGQKMLKISFTHNPNSLDPRKGSDAVGSTIHFTLFDGLTRMNETSTHEPSTAERIEISDDKTIYTFHLRDSNWSNGDKVVAEDFAYAWRTILDPKFPSPNAHLLYPIKNAEKVKTGVLNCSELGIEVVDDKTLKITLERPTPYFLDLTSFCVLFPVPSKIVKNNPKWADQVTDQFVTNGPFSLKSWKFSNELLFKRNPHFWDRKSVKLDSIRASIIDNETTALALFNSGELDFMGAFLTNIQTDWIPELKKASKLLHKPFGATKIVTFNINSFPFNNLNIRKAFAHAINRRALIDNITQFEELPATGYVNPVLKNNRANTYFSDGDLDAAREYMSKGLEELGLRHPSEIGQVTYDYYNTSTEKKLAQALQQQWNKAFGIEVRLNETDFNIHMDKLNRRDYQFGQFMYIAQYNDQMNILDRFKVKTSPKNYPGWENPEYAKLLDESAYAKTADERLEILERAERIMVSEMPFTGLYHWENIYMQNSRVHDFFISPIGSIHLINTYIEE